MPLPLGNYKHRYKRTGTKVAIWGHEWTGKHARVEYGSVEARSSPGSICYSAVVTLNRNQLPNIAGVDSTPARFSAKKLFLPAKRHTPTQPLCYQHVEEQSD
jgi:hypothetical protein